MRINYTTDLKDEYGRTVWPDIECVVDVSVTFDPQDPAVSIDSIDIIGFDGNVETEINLHNSRLAILRLLEGHLASVLGLDDNFYGRALEEAGITYKGRGPNDPDGRYIEKVA